MPLPEIRCSPAGRVRQPRSSGMPTVPRRASTPARSRPRCTWLRSPLLRRSARTAAACRPRRPALEGRSEHLQARRLVPRSEPLRSALDAPAFGGHGPQGRERYPLAQLGKRDSGCCSRLRDQTRLGHAWKSVRFETIKAAVVGHPKINPCASPQLECLKGLSRQILRLARFVRGNLRRKYLFGHPRRVLAFVVVDLVLWDDFADGEGLVIQDADRELPTGDELLDHDLVVVLEGLRDGRGELLPPLHDGKAHRRPLLRRLHDHRNRHPPELILGRLFSLGHRPVCRRDAGTAEQVLRQILVHRKGAPRWPLPVYLMPARSRRAWIVPSSPNPPCRPRNTTSAFIKEGSARSICGSVSFAMRESSSCDGGSFCTTFPFASSCFSSSGVSVPRAVSRETTSWPRARRASATRSELASDTSRSADVPPINTVIFIVVSYRAREASGESSACWQILRPYGRRMTCIYRDIR